MLGALAILVLQLNLIAFMQLPAWQPSEIPPFDGGQAEIPLQSAELIGATAHELETKGWTDLEIIKGKVDSGRWGGLVIDAIDIEDHMDLYTLLGKTDGMYHNPITVAVEMTFDHETLEWKRQSVFYASEAGRCMGADGWKSDEILAADDEMLWGYMYSY